MSDRRPKLWHDAWKAAGLATSFLGGAGFDDYLGNEYMRSAVERKILIVGEALTRAFDLDPSLADVIPDLHEIRGMRNRLAHLYDKTDHRIVFDTVHDDFPVLRERLATLMRMAGWRDDDTLAPGDEETAKG